MIFIGLEWMKTSMGHLVNLMITRPGMSQRLSIHSIRILITMLIQSSTTNHGYIMLVALQQGLMSFDRCVAMVALNWVLR